MKSYKLLLCLIATKVALIANLAFANPTTDEAKSFVETLSQQVIEIIKNDALNDSNKSAQLSDKFVDALDIKWIARFVLGPNFRTLSDQQFATFKSSYEKFLINTYVPKFKHYNREVIRVTSVEQIDENRFKVLTIIDREHEADVRVDYMVKYYPDEARFKAFDIIAEDISMITTHRTEFGSLMTQKGFDGMIEHIKAKKPNQ